MAELLVRFSAGHAALLDRLARAHRGAIGRVVVDAHTAAAVPALAAIARRAGLPMLVDPETFYLQDHQHDGDAWASLPFASRPALTPADLMSAGRQDQLVADCLSFQLAHGATSVIPPYVHIERADDGWAEVQIGLLRRTRRFLEAENLDLPVVAVLALSWRLVARTSWPAVFDRVNTALRDLAPAEVAVAASKIDQGKHPERRLGGFYAVIERLARTHPSVLVWNQGLLGEAGVAAGASGYETGIGKRERCDLRTRMSGRRKSPGIGFGAPAIYIAALGRSLPKKTVAALLEDPLVGPRLVCTDTTCCPLGRQTLAGDCRTHAVLTRARRLALLSANQHPRWAWNHLANDADAGLVLADRINTHAARRDEVSHVDTGALTAIAATAAARRDVTRRRAA